MRRRNSSFFAGMAIGLVAGLTAGLVGLAHSTTGKKAWDRFGEQFQAGYITGFLDCVQIAKAMDFEGYVATNFIMPPGAKPTHFQAWINREGYTNPKLAERTLPQMLVIAGNKLQATFGPEAPLSGTMSIDAMRALIDQRRKAIREAHKLQTTLEAERETEKQAAAGASSPETKSDDTKPLDKGVETEPGEVPPAN